MQVVDPKKASYGIDNYRFASIQLAQTTMRSIIGKLDFDKTFEERENINNVIVAAVDRASEPWGIKVTRYEVKNILPPQSIKDAMEKQMRAEREKRALIAESEGDRQAKINRAEGEKCEAIARSEGEKQKRINEAEGRAVEIQRVAEATAEGIRKIALAINDRGGAEAVNLRIAEQYLTEFGKLAKTNNTMIIPSNLADIAGVIKTAASVIRPSTQAPAAAPTVGTAPRNVPATAMTYSPCTRMQGRFLTHASPFVGWNAWGEAPPYYIDHLKAVGCLSRSQSWVPRSNSLDCGFWIGSAHPRNTAEQVRPCHPAHQVGGASVYTNCRPTKPGRTHPLLRLCFWLKTGRDAVTLRADSPGIRAKYFHESEVLVVGGRTMRERRFKTSIISTVSAVMLLSSLAQGPVEAGDGPLMTRWAKEVSPENALPEYPRPQMVRKDWQNLNGLWDYAITAKDAARPESFDGQILVPFPIESALSGVMKPVGPDNRLWYRRTFEIPAGPSDGRRGPAILLHFGAVDWDATVWVNGKEVGNHMGGYDPFTFDITDALKAERPQEIVLSVWDPTNAGTQPRGKQVRNPAASGTPPSPASGRPSGSNR